MRNIGRGVICSMTVSFKDKDTEKLWLGEFVRRLDGIRKQALMRLGRLEAATSLWRPGRSLRKPAGGP